MELKIIRLLRKLRSLSRTGAELARITADPVLSKFRPGNAALLHLGRSGSTVLGSTLGQHRRIFWDGEALVPPLTETAGTREPKVAQRILRDRIRRAGSRYYLLSAKIYHLAGYGLSPREGVSLLSELGFTHFIVLRRKNLLRKLVSSVIASHTGDYHRRVTEAVAEPTPVHIDPRRVAIDGDPKPLLAHLETWTAGLESLDQGLSGHPTLHLTYEGDVERNPLRAYQLVCRFLQLREGRPLIAFQRTNPFEMRELITNYSEVVNELSGTRFEWMLVS